MQAEEDSLHSDSEAEEDSLYSDPEEDVDSSISDREEQDESHSDQEEQDESHSDQASSLEDRGLYELPNEFDEGDAELRGEEDLLQVPAEASFGEEGLPEAPKEVGEAELGMESNDDHAVDGEEEDMPEAPPEAAVVSQMSSSGDDARAGAEDTLEAPSGDEPVPKAPREADEADEADADIELASPHAPDGVTMGEEEDMPEAPPEAHSEAEHRVAEQAEDPAEHRLQGSPAEWARHDVAAVNREAAEQAADLADSEDEIWTDEGRAFALALKEAQAALDAARQFVVSPWDRKSVGAPPPPPARNMEDLEEAPDAAEAPAAAAAAATETPSPLAADVPENDVSASKEPSDAGFDPIAEKMPLAPPPPRVPGRTRAATHSPRSVPGRHREPSPSGIPRRHRALSPGSVPGSHKATPRAARDASPRIPEPPKSVADVNSLHVRFGENAARSRVERAHSMDRAEKLRKQAEVEVKATMAAQNATVVEASRRQAGRRAASERHAKQVAEQKELETRLVELARRESSERAGKRYAAGAARRAQSEKSRQEVMIQEVLADLGTVQSERRETAERSGRELQRRCNEADWSHAKPAVQTGRRRPAQPPAPQPAQPPAPPGNRRLPGKGIGNAAGGAGGRSSASLPLLPKLLPHGAQMPAAAPSAARDLRLPPIPPSARAH